MIDVGTVSCVVAVGIERSAGVYGVILVGIGWIVVGTVVWNWDGI